jgi:hypothetical protein
MPHLLWQGASVFPVSSEGPISHSFATYNTQKDVKDLLLPGSSQVPIQLSRTTHKGMWRTYSNPNPHRSPFNDLTTHKECCQILLIPTWIHIGCSVCSVEREDLIHIMYLVLFVLFLYQQRSNEDFVRMSPSGSNCLCCTYRGYNEDFVRIWMSPSGSNCLCWTYRGSQWRFCKNESICRVVEKCRSCRSCR